jgi:CHAT domain-containing protein/tetratricopeptide (TPR) repeat protein
LRLYRLTSFFVVLTVFAAGAYAQQAPKLPAPSKEISDMLDAAAKLPPKDRPAAAKKIIARAEQIRDRPGEGRAFLWMGFWLDELSEFHEAVEAYNKALPIWREVGDRAGEARTLNNIGKVCDDLGQKQKALDFYNQALLIEREAGDRTGEAATLSNIGKVYDDLGQKQNALDFYNQALPFRREIRDRYGEAVTLNNIGLVYDALGQKQKALDFYNQALPISREAGDRAGEAVTLNNIGGVYDALGQKQKAMDFYNQALPISREVGDRAGEAVTLNNIGEVYDSLGQKQKALDFYNQALTIEREVGDCEAASLQNIGKVYYALGQMQKALDFYNQALPIEREVGDRAGEAATLNNMGEVYHDLGQNQKALDFFNQALPNEREVGDRRAEATTLSNIGEVYDDLGQKQKALEFLNQALPIERQVGYRAGEAMTLNNIGHTVSVSNQPDAVVVFLKMSVNVFQSLRADIAGLDSGVQHSYRDSVAWAYRDLADVLVKQGRLGEAERVLALLKDNERFEFVRRDPAVRTIQQQVDYVGREQGWMDRWNAIQDRAVALGTQIADLRRTKAKAEREGTTFDGESKLKTLLADEDVVDKEMAAFYDVIFKEAEDQKKFIAANQKKELEEFQANVGEVLGDLEDKTGSKVAAVYTLVTDNSVDFIVATRNGASPISMSVDEKTLNAKTVALVNALTDPTQDPKGPGLALYNLVFKKVVDQLKALGINHVMWTLDGALRYVPLAAVWDGNHYLVEEESFTVYSPLELLKLAKAPDAHPKVAGFGATRGGVIEDRSFPDLPNVREEIDSVVNDPAKQAHGLVEGVPWLDSAFTENVLLTQMGDSSYYRIAHIASHFDLRGDFEKSVLLTGDGKLVSLKTLLGGMSNLEQAQKTKPWSHLDLVVLSACDTAGTAERADIKDASAGAESESFASVVLSMGASSVMASLWSVSDESTALLMKEFYKNWVSGMTKAEALRQAQIAMLNGHIRPGAAASGNNRGMTTHAPVQQGGFTPDKARPFAHPYYWAPFLIYGNWR